MTTSLDPKPSAASPDPEVCVLSRYARSWPVVIGDKERRITPDDLLVEPLPLTQALAALYPADHHFTAYAPRFVDLDADETEDGQPLSSAAVRLNSAAVRAGLQARLTPAPVVEMQLLIVDVDDVEAHASGAPAGEAWRAAERLKLARLDKVGPGFLRFATRGGYRLIWALAAPFEIASPYDAVEWKQFYAGALAWLKQHASIEGDPACADWTRLYRLPNVEREGIGEQRAAVEGSLSQLWPADMSRCVVCPLKPRASHAGADSTDPEPGDPAVVSALVAQLADALAPTWFADGRQGWFLPFLGWLHGKGWAYCERQDLIDLLTEHRDDGAERYSAMNERTHTLEGPSVEVKAALAESFAVVDKLVNAHPNANRAATIYRARAKRAAASTTEAANDTDDTAAERLKERHGKIEGSLGNVATILRCDSEWRGVLGYDEFACRVLALREPPMREQDRPNTPTIGEWTDAHTARTRAWLAEQLDSEPGKDATDCAVEIVARSQTFHPVRDYLNALVWDGKARLDSMLEAYFGVAQSPYAQLVGSKFMIAAVARARKPGCKVDTMLILEGPQGAKKSTAVSFLTGPDWFADTALDFESKDAAQCLQGKWIYEIGELASFNRSEANRIKAFVSSQSDNLRPSYGRRNQDFPRQCVFVGTTNDGKYLTDTTGNRRYWPVRCGAIDVAALKRDRDQLWAEASARHASGERWWLDSTEERLAQAEQVERESEDPWEASLVTWLARRAKLPEPAFTLADALKEACGLKAGEQSTAHSQRVGRLLAKLGYESKRRRDPSNRAGFSRAYEKR